MLSEFACNHAAETHVFRQYVDVSVYYPVHIRVHIPFVRTLLCG
jgi:hypothetical protein